VKRRRILLAAAAVLAVGLSGCGIPDETEVRDIGPAPEPGFASRGEVGQGPPTRDSATGKESFVSNFLAAGAGMPDKALGRIRDYLTESSRGDLEVEPDAGLNIVRVRDTTFVEDRRGSYKVTIKVDQVGVLSAEGSVGPPVLDQKAYTFEIGGVDGPDGWYVTSPPINDALLLSTDALRVYFTPLTLYFWSNDRTTLVPDTRYMPSERDEGQRPNDVVDWLIKGPSDWLNSAVSPLNDKSERRQNVPYPNDQLQVGLNALAAEPQTTAEARIDLPEQLGYQLMWSLRPYLKGDLELRIDGQSQKVFKQDQKFYAANAAYHPASGPEQGTVQPERFAIYQGKIHRLRSSPGGGVEPLPRLLLASGVNDALVSAALARETGDGGVRTAAALVKRKGQQVQLEVGAVVGDDAHPLAASNAYASLGRPVWLKAPMDAGLVVVDKKFLYRFTPDGPAMERVALPDGIDGKVTDVAAAQDGRRIAVVSGGQVYLLGIARDGVTVEVKEARRVPTTLRTATAVDWSSEAKIVVAGTGPDNKDAVWEMSLDGAIEDEQVLDTGGTVTHLAAYPVGPVVDTVTKVMYARDGAGYDLEGVRSEIEDGEVVGASGDFDPQQVTAPFFLLD
jgi:hypothetical protein